MKLRVAINGFGRIGRSVLRALYENHYDNQIEVVAINDLAQIKTAAHLLKYDSVHGRFAESVLLDEGAISVADDSIYYLNQPCAEKLPWDLLNIDCVLECSGKYNSKSAANAHLTAGARQVLISAPAPQADATIVYGVNHHMLNRHMKVVSSASCTTNCLAPIAQVLHEAFGIEHGSVTTIHAVTNDQNLHDVDHRDLYRARSAVQSMIPAQTGAAAALGLVLPELAGKLDGMAVRVPTMNVSMIDFHFIASRETSVAEVNRAVQLATRTPLGQILDYNHDPLVSIDFNHHPASAIFDASQTKVTGRLVKVMAWFDNEWGFSNRMLDNALAMHALQSVDLVSTA